MSINSEMCINGECSVNTAESRVLFCRKFFFDKIIYFFLKYLDRRGIMCYNVTTKNEITNIREEGATCQLHLTLFVGTRIQ